MVSALPKMFRPNDRTDATPGLKLKIEKSGVGVEGMKNTQAVKLLKEKKNLMLKISIRN